MKLTQENNPVEIGGVSTTPSTFQIKASREAFKILSSGLYNNKIRAIIRELSCNAYDAHVAAGKRDEPFEIHLPTSLEPEFRVKDNGTGLSHDDVLALYTTYFGTNKTESNEFVGALGLGSKSPFCYTEGFTVTSRFQGMTRIYSCFIDGNGMPSVLLQEEQETPDTPNGLEVRFPVNTNDCWEFENQAKAALEFFNPKPNLNKEVHINNTEYLMKTEEWGLREKGSGFSGLRAIQGMVPYSVGKIDTSRLDAVQQRLMELELDLFFDIGELSVAASRETLSNDDYTINNILKKMSGIKDKLLENLIKDLKKCVTPWEARIKIFSLISTPGIGKIVNDAYNKGELDSIFDAGFKLDHKDPEICQLDYPNINFVKFSHSWRYSNSGQSYASKYTIGVTKERIDDDIKRHGKLDREVYNITIRSERDTVFVINDIGFGVERYIHYFLQEDRTVLNPEKKISTIIFINRGAKDVPIDHVKKMGVKLLEAFGNPPFFMASELKAKYQKAIPQTTQQPYVKKEVMHFDMHADVRYRREGGYTAQGWRAGWSMIDVKDPKKLAALDSLETKYYVKLKSLEPQGTISFAHAEAFKKFIENVVASKKFSITSKDPIFGLPMDSPYLGKPGWVELTSYILLETKKFMTPEFEHKLSLIFKPFQEDTDGLLSALNRRKPLDPESPIQLFAITLKSLVSAKNEYQALVAVLNTVGYKVTNTTDYNILWKSIKLRYPMLEYCMRGYYGDPSTKTQDIINYLKLIDDLNKPKPAVQPTETMPATLAAYPIDEEEVDVTIN